MGSNGKPPPFKAGMVIAVPSRGNIRVEWAAALKMLEPPLNFSWMIRTLIGEEVDDARNGCVLDARECGAEYLLFLDDDVLVPNQGIRKMHYLMENNPDWDLLSGVYVTKSDPPQTVIFKEGKDGPYWDWKFGTNFPIGGCGMGCAMIRMNVFDKVPEPWFKFVRKPQGIHHFEEGEDLYFCRKMREAGLKMMACGELLCGHINKDGAIYSLPMDSYPVQNAGEENLKRYTALDASASLPVAK